MSSAAATIYGASGIKSREKNKMTVHKKFPLIVLRQIAVNPEKYPGYLEKIFEQIDRHPGCVDEIWLPADVWYFCRSAEEIRRYLENLKPCAEMCRKRGIRVGIQCCTLGHTPKEVPPPQGYPFSENAWCEDKNGRKAYCCLCPSSPEVHVYLEESAKIMLEVLKPDSLWPDDDMRLGAKGDSLCFCPRCLARFNMETDNHFTRETLAGELFGEHPSLKTRKQWVDFNGRMLGESCAAYRRAIDAVQPVCLLGLQKGRSTHKYDSEDGSQISHGLAGERNEIISIRAGGGFYHDLFPRDMIRKAFDVGREAARFKANGFRGGICSECESYPHVSVQKNPGTLMTEAALDIAAGAKYASLYWHSPMNQESEKNYEFFMRTLQNHRPFIEAVAKATADTGLAGCALYEGQDYLALPEWLEATDETEERLLENGLPMSLPGASPELFAINERTAKSLNEDDLKVCFSKPVLMDIAALEIIGRKFPQLQFLRKIQLKKPNMQFFMLNDSATEVFHGKYQAEGVARVICKTAPDVILTSSVAGTSDKNIGASAIIPSGFGGKIVLVQFLNIWHGWTGYRRECILDALDQIVPGRMAVRLLTSGYAVCTFAHTTADGKAACAFLLNAAVGDTPVLRIAMRRPAFEKYRLQRQAAEPLELKVLSQTADEIVLELPPLAPWRAVLIEGVEK